jgi:hypothetical protein
MARGGARSVAAAGRGRIAAKKRTWRKVVVTAAAAIQAVLLFVMKDLQLCVSETRPSRAPMERIL